MRHRIQPLNPVDVLDIGVGAGTYGTVLRELCPGAKLTGVEAWAPYVDQFDLHAIYDEIIVADVRYLAALPRADVVILGDVLEHMTEDEAIAVWRMARGAARKAVYLSIPIIHYPQGHLEGNPFEEHIVDDWTHERVLATFEGIGAHWTGTIVGAYEAVVA
jgi:trans-aconitate methyltransferase